MGEGPATAPMGLLAELTHRCPLGCPYCSNPVELEAKGRELSTDDWRRVFAEAAALGVLQVHLSGGEPASRRDLVDLVAGCVGSGLYVNLITSGVGVTESLLVSLVDAGLDHVQLSIQDADPESCDRIAGYRGAFVQKERLARAIAGTGCALTINAPIHRANVARAADMVRLAHRWGAQRVEIAHVQYYGWALLNRGMLMPAREDALAAVRAVETCRLEMQGVILVDHVLPDYFASRPKACMGGWGRKIINVAPGGDALPCHAAQTIPGLEFWNVRERSLDEIWRDSPAFRAFRGTAWMKEPCRSCNRRELDFGGCRCQAMLLAGDSREADPACELSPFHASIADARAEPAHSEGYVYRRYGARGHRLSP